MTAIVHPDVFDNGLSQLVGVNLSYVICQTEPLTVTDCTSLSGSGGKRVSLIESLSSGVITIGNGTGGIDRQITIPERTFNSTVQVPVSSGVADLWVAVYDGSRILLKSDELVNRELLLDATIIVPLLNYGFGQEV